MDYRQHLTMALLSIIFGSFFMFSIIWYTVLDYTKKLGTHYANPTMEMPRAYKANLYVDDLEKNKIMINMTIFIILVIIAGISGMFTYVLLNHQVDNILSISSTTAIFIVVSHAVLTIASYICQLVHFNQMFNTIISKYKTTRKRIHVKQLEVDLFKLASDYGEKYTNKSWIESILNGLCFIGIAYLVWYVSGHHPYIY